MRSRVGWLAVLALGLSCVGLPGVGLAGPQEGSQPGESPAWIRLQRAGPCACTIYIDLMHSQHGPDSAVISAIQDFDRPTGTGARPVLSVAFQSAFKCSDTVYDTLSTADFSDHMGRGDVLTRSSAATGWRAIPPGAEEIDRIRRIACNPKDYLR